MANICDELLLFFHDVSAYREPYQSCQAAYLKVGLFLCGVFENGLQSTSQTKLLETFSQTNLQASISRIFATFPNHSSNNQKRIVACMIFMVFYLIVYAEQIYPSTSLISKEKFSSVLQKNFGHIQKSEHVISQICDSIDFFSLVVRPADIALTLVLDSPQIHCLYAQKFFGADFFNQGAFVYAFPPGIFDVQLTQNAKQNQGYSQIQNLFDDIFFSLKDLNLIFSCLRLSHLGRQSFFTAGSEPLSPLTSLGGIISTFGNGGQDFVQRTVTVRSFDAAGEVSDFVLHSFKHRPTEWYGPYTQAGTSKRVKIAASSFSVVKNQNASNSFSLTAQRCVLVAPQKSNPYAAQDPFFQSSKHFFMHKIRSYQSPKITSESALVKRKMYVDEWKGDCYFNYTTEKVNNDFWIKGAIFEQLAVPLREWNSRTPGLAINDLKLQNMLIDRAGSVKFIDFEEINSSWISPILFYDRFWLTDDLPDLNWKGYQANRKANPSLFKIEDVVVNLFLSNDSSYRLKTSIFSIATTILLGLCYFKKQRNLQKFIGNFFAVLVFSGKVDWLTLGKGTSTTLREGWLFYCNEKIQELCTSTPELADIPWLGRFFEKLFLPALVGEIDSYDAVLRIFNEILNPQPVALPSVVGRPPLANATNSPPRGGTRKRTAEGEIKKND